MAKFKPALYAVPLLFAASLWASGPARAEDHDADDSPSKCHLGNGIKHIVHVQFDNVHFRRDNPNVPSDLEQMPNLLNFLQDNGTVLTNHHTPLISHTSDDIITTLTGTYGEKHGQPVGNSYGFFRPDGSVGFSSSFAYWTDTAPDGQPQMIDQRGKVHPAPWVPFTRAGCDVGAFSTANIEFENTTTDIDNVFGPTSAEHNEAHDPSAAIRAKAVADFEGIAVHCAKGSPLCANGQMDVLKDEPGGYVGFNALFGNQFVAPAITGIPGNLVVKDLNGVQIDDGNTPPNPGFPGFDPSAAQSLGYIATMLEAGVPVVYAYIADTHDNHVTFSGSFGPGETGYVQQNAQYNDAFGKFFARLAADGITKENTIFIVTADENDHFAGKPGAPAGCDGVTTPCTYIRLPAGCDGDTTPCTTTNLGEVAIDLRRLLITPPFNNTTVFSVHSDDAPTVYINGNPGQTAAVTRTLERDMAKLLAFDPIKNGNVPVMQRLAGTAEMSFLHMLTKDPARNPTFTLFGDDDFFITAGSTPTPCPSLTACSDEQPGFNWNHGDFQEDITKTWLGIVGPGVENLGRNGAFFSDHTDVRPTMLSLAGLKDDYAHDGRVLFEVFDEEAVPRSLRKDDETLERLAQAYKAINAPVGTLGVLTLKISTTGLAGDNATFAAVDDRIGDITARRNMIAGQMIAMLENAAFNNTPINDEKAEELIEAAAELIENAQ
jgi:hypothetical protein